MDIKDLNRSQFLLLLFLLVFVTSISTAIVTVTLMDQSPTAGVTNTINRVVERVVPGATTTVVQIVKEIERVPSNEGAQIVKTAESAESSMLKIELLGEKGRERLGTAFLIRSDLAVTASRNLSSLGEGAQIQIVKGSNVIPARVALFDEVNKVAFLSFTATSSLLVSNLPIANSAPSSGATAIGLAYSDIGSPEIAVGIIIGLINTNSATSTVKDSDSFVIRTSAVAGENIGGPLLNPSGELLGIGIARGYALSAKTLRVLVDQIK